MGTIGRAKGQAEYSLLKLHDAASRRATPGRVSVLLALGGPVCVLAREGRFELSRGQWLAFDAESQAEVRTLGEARALLLEVPAGRLAALPALAAIALPNRGELQLGALRRIRAMRHAGRRPGPIETALDDVLRVLLAHAHLVAAGDASCPGRTRQRRRNVLSRLQRVRLFLEGHPDRVVRMEELAHLSHFSSWYLSRTFRRVYGASPQAYGLEVRLLRAHRLVTCSRDAICDIAAACGFDNPSAFARAFRARFGASPSRVRWKETTGRGTHVA
jgi:AraC family transcriptional regulator